jgi:hypothetical protein
MKTRSEFIEELRASNEIVRDHLTKKQTQAKLTSLLNNKWNATNYTIKKNHRKLTNEIIKTAKLFKAARYQREIKRLVISIIWERGSMQAMQTRAEVDVYYKSGGYQSFNTSKTGGYGYCKESTTLAEIFNSLLRYKIVDDRRKKTMPYGIRKQSSYFLPYFEGGVGASCYYDISEYIDGLMKQIASTTKTTTYEVTFR